MKATTVSSQQRSSQQKGFTIIETLIVLAVAGMIAVIVLYAVPSLQRNSRNNQRKQEVSTILQAVSKYELNNSANFPSDPVALLRNSKITMYDPATSLDLCAKDTTCLAPVTDVEKVRVVNYAFCDSDTPGSAISKGADYSNIVALYAIETTSGYGSKCQKL